MYHIVTQTPTTSYSIRTHSTLREAREDLRRILKAYKADYKRKHHVRLYCYWMGKNKISTARICNDDTIGDTVFYYIQAR